MQFLYFVRHGQTEFNKADYVQGGQVDSPLLESSKQDAKKTGVYLNQMGISRIITSPQARALDTAKLILEQFDSKVPLEKDARLKEFLFGDWEGKYIPDLKKEYPQAFYNLRNRPDLYDPSAFGGETYSQLIDRGTQAILSHVDSHPTDSLLFVAHSITLTSSILTLAGYQVNDLRSKTPMANTSITRMKRIGKHFEIDSWNEIDHLNEANFHH